jgi:predicted DNA-binding protein (UPF0251 family)
VKVNPTRRSSGSSPSPARQRAKVIDEQKLLRIVQLIFLERYTLRDAADTIGVSHMTVYRALQNANIRVEGDYGRLYGKMFDSMKM